MDPVIPSARYGSADAEWHMGGLKLIRLMTDDSCVDVHDKTPSLRRDLMIATLIVWAGIVVVAALFGPFALIAALIGCAFVFVTAAFIGGSILDRFPMIEVLIVLALGVAGGLAVVWWASQPLTTECGGLSCGVASSVSGAPGP
jgi:hypothetical protein